MATTVQTEYLPTEPAGASVDLDGTGSTDPDGDALTYWWYEGATPLGQGATLTHLFPAGEHTVSLFVEDGQHRVGPSEVTFTVLPGSTTVGMTR